MRDILIEKPQRKAAENRAFTTFGRVKSERRILWALLRFRSRRDTRMDISGENARPGDTIWSVTSKGVRSDRRVNSDRKGTRGMSPVTTSSVARQIESLFDGASVTGLTDRQLIERFTARRDATGEAAFTALVNRHGPMVLDICRQVLGAPHDAEDAFQAVFLVLACKARSVRDPDLLLSPSSASASVSAALCEITARAAIEYSVSQARAGATSAGATALAHEVLRSMLIHKLKLVALTLLFLGTVATGAGYAGRQLARETVQPQPQTPQAEKPGLLPIAAKANENNGKPGPGRMFVVGRVLDPQGKPVPSATIMVYTANRIRGADPYDGMNLLAIGHASTDSSGRFHVDALRTASSRHYRAGAVALAPGYGAGWIDLDPDADQPGVDITLRPEQMIKGRLVDLNGQPARDVAVFVQMMGRAVQKKPGGSLPESVEGPYFLRMHQDDLPAWPKPATTDAEGRYTVRGIGRDVRVILGTDDPRFARFRFPIDTGAAGEPKPVTTALEPAKTMTGRITDAETGKPIPHAKLMITSISEGGHRGTFNEFEGDADGRFRANPLSAERYFVTVSAVDGQPYLSTHVRPVDWTKGAVERRLDVTLRRGVVIRGKVIEEGSQIPIADANLSFSARRGQVDKTYAGTSSTTAVTAADGSFQLVVPPRPGTLVVMGPSEDYVLQEIGQRMINEGEPGGLRVYAHAFIACAPKPGSQSVEVDIVLRRGVKLEGRVVAPDGRPIQAAAMISRLFFPPGRRGGSTWETSHNSTGKGGRFEVHGLDSETAVPVHFLEPKLKLGATARFSGKSAAGGPATVRLEPCGSARARFVSPEGKPLPGLPGSRLTRIRLVVSPGPYPDSKSAVASLIANVGYLEAVDPTNYEPGPGSDAQGRITFPALIPGATYRVYDRTAAFDLRREFNVKPGETFDLGDILIEKPEP
jgi:Carboxypeptidase regulatory-like domain/Sigma-70 region 2